MALAIVSARLLRSRGAEGAAAEGGTRAPDAAAGRLTRLMLPVGASFSSSATICSATMQIHPVFLSSADIQLGVKETVEDTAHVLGRMFDCIEFRGFKTRHVEILSEVSGIPVINGLSDDFHPTQVLADLMTLEEHFGSLKGRKLAFVGDGRNNMANSLMIGCAKMGVNVAIVAPDELHPESDLVKLAEGFAKDAGSTVLITSDVEDGIKDADVIYTDVWASMGEEAKLAERIKLLKPYQVNTDLMAKTGKESVFMHCLPAVRNNEVTPDVIDGKQSDVNIHCL